MSLLRSPTLYPTLPCAHISEWSHTGSASSMGPVVSTLTMQMLSEPLSIGHMVSMTIAALPQWCVSSLQCTFGLDKHVFLLAKREKGNSIFLSEKF